MKFDSILIGLGGFGKYQIILVVLMNVMSGWPGPFLTILYTAMSLPYSCSIAPNNDTWLQDENQTQIHDHCNKEVFNKTSEVSCTAWEYDHSEYGMSIIEKYDLVCDRAWLLPMSNSLFLFGVLVGSQLVGYLSDRFGRIRAATAASIFYLTWWYVSYLSPNYPLFAVSRFLIGAGRIGFFISGFIYCMEIVGPQWRLVVGMMHNVSYALGYMLAAGIAYALKDGQNYELVSVIPLTACILILIFIPESPRWLLVSQNYEKAKKVLSRMADINKRDRSIVEDVTNVADLNAQTTKEGNLIHLFKSPTMRKRILILMFCWVSINMMYFAVTYNAQALIPGNYYLNHFLLGFMEIPGSVVGVLSSKWRITGRRLTCAIMLCVPGLLAIINVPLVIYEADVWVTVSAMVAMCSLTGAYNLLYIYTAELLPTEVRNVGFGACSTIGRLGAISSTFIGHKLTLIWKPLPYVIFAAVGTIGGLLTTLLPETRNKPLCETIQEAEERSRSEENNRHVHDVDGATEHL